MSMPGTPVPPGYGPGAAAPARQVKSKRSTRIYILAALAAAVVAGAIVLLATGGPKGQWVMVARQAIPARATLDADLFEPRRLPDDALISGALTADSEDGIKEEFTALDLDGSVAQYPLAKGGQFSKDLISLETDLARPLSPDERLVSVPGTFALTLAGTLKPGDRVDVYGVATKIGDSSGGGLVNLVASDVEVVSVSLPEDQVTAVYQRQLDAASEGEQLTASELLPASPIPGVFTLRVPADIAGRLGLLASTNAGSGNALFLTYRGADAAPTAAVPVELEQIMCATSTPAVPAVDPAAPPTTVAVPAPLPAVCQRYLLSQIDR
jgi:hypothetical protein